MRDHGGGSGEANFVAPEWVAYLVGEEHEMALPADRGFGSSRSRDPAAANKNGAGPMPAPVRLCLPV